MDTILSEREGRIIGVLIEKNLATPEYYPLSLNALTNACNQKTNRDPVVELDESEVLECIKKLKQNLLVIEVRTHGSRTSKFEHNLTKIAPFSTNEIAILCVLLLRGKQTPGELRARTARLSNFPTVNAVEYTLSKLINHEAGPFVAKLGRDAGKKENRYQHLFFGIEASAQSDPQPCETRVVQAQESSDPIFELQNRISRLELQLSQLNEEFQDFKNQF